MTSIILSAAILFNVGTYGDNIHYIRYSDKSFELLGSTPASNASYLALDEEGRLYGVSENDPQSGLYSFNDGLATLSVSGDNCPCHLLKPAGYPFVATADYGGGGITVFDISDGVAGRIVQTVRYAEGSRIHQLMMIPGTDLMLATDLGLCCIHVLKLGGGPQPLSDCPERQVPCSGGPRHMVFSKDASIMYCITEKSGEIAAFHVCRDGKLSEFQRIKADEADAHGSADIRISGRYLYASHRLANDGISVFRIRRDGHLVKKAYTHTGRHPRCFVFADKGRRVFVACRDDNSIEVYRVNRLTGRIRTKEAEIRLPDRPVCLIQEPPSRSRAAF